MASETDTFDRNVASTGWHPTIGRWEVTSNVGDPEVVANLRDGSAVKVQSRGGVWSFSIDDVEMTEAEFYAALPTFPRVTTSPTS